MQYHVAGSFEEATKLAAALDGTVRFLAGGTDVIVQMRLGLVQPDHVVDLKNIPGATAIAATPEGGWRVGAAVSGAQMKAHEGLRRDWPGLLEGMNVVGSTQVQGRATMAGNLCNGSPAADSVPGLIAAGATATVVGPAGAREVGIEAIPTGPGKTSLKKGEVIAAITLPPRAAGEGDAYLRFIPRTEMDIAVAGAAVNLALDAEGRVARARVALGAVAPTALLVAEAGAALVGSKLEDAALDRMVAAVRAACRPITDRRGTAEFRTEVAGVLARRAALRAFERAGKNKAGKTGAGKTGK